jgi:N-acetylmuramoyl-L-alanine amidase
MRTLNEIIIHCTATPEGREHSVADIRGWHKAKGWADIGYHFVIGLDGTVRPGRPLSQIGAHVAGRNSDTIGIVYVGGLAKNGAPKDTRTDAQKSALLRLVTYLVKKFPDISKVSGHNEYANKACPCFDVSVEYSRFNSPSVASLMSSEKFVIKTRGITNQAGEKVPKGVVVATTGVRQGDWIETDHGMINEATLDQREVGQSNSASRKIQGGTMGLAGVTGTALTETAKKIESLVSLSEAIQWLFIALTVGGLIWHMYASIQDHQPGKVPDV